ncbi:phosphoribosylamine--glycine ligase [Thermodesulfovibrionales bacterium]|nr:phosphoribosylamine--glycine ligase [Thermodesulfovibrionales bacterium]MCL0071469.1 phosphoribosylamine--glycine ligase [Thermodesulfovibrionales bacterium]MCL0083749.1 phosphoribosylamine--glycine ligase [Thermodesulfovibrionales bacterium]
MKALVIGGGGREHAIVWKLMQSRHVDKVYCMPGNAGIAEIAECIDVHSLDFNKLVDFVRYEWVDLTIVGPEGPLSGGIVDAFEREGRRIVGSTKMATQLESSKVFAKEFMKRYRIPTAEYKVFTSYIHAEEYVRMKGLPIVIKADGLAAGKGVFVASRAEEVVDALRLVMKERIFGDAGNRVIVEQYLEGEEVSFMAFTDGSTIIPMVSSQDYKRVFDNDEGPNTGGMGAYSPAPVITRELESIIMERIMRPAISGLKAMGIKYKGVLYAGLIIDNGNPYVLEFNCRFGDPEAQSILSRLNTDIMDIFMAITDERLSDINIEWSDEAAVCVVLASEGYPGKYKRGKVIHGLNDVRDMDDVVVFHAGTAFNDNEIITKGGRVLGVTATGKDINGAKERSYEAVKRIHFEGMHYRKDIANKALNRQ